MCDWEADSTTKKTYVIFLKDTYRAQTTLIYDCEQCIEQKVRLHVSLVTDTSKLNGAASPGDADGRDVQNGVLPVCCKVSCAGPLTFMCCRP